MLLGPCSRQYKHAVSDFALEGRCCSTRSLSGACHVMTATELLQDRNETGGGLLQDAGKVRVGSSRN